MSVLTIVLLVAGTLGALLVFGGISKKRQLAAKRAGTYANAFVMVEDDGTARELTPEERVHLNGEYTFGDGAMPYVKSSYHSLTPDNRMRGYLPRSKVPWNITVRPST